MVADIDGDDHLEVLLPSNWDVVVWDRYGNQLSRGAYPLAPDALILKTEYALSAGVGVGDVDGDNDLEVVAAGADANPPTAGALYAWDFSSGVESAQPWPLFRHNIDNRAWIDNGSIFADGFESGDTAAWSSATP